MRAFTSLGSWSLSFTPTTKSKTNKQKKLAAADDRNIEGAKGPQSIKGQKEEHLN